MKKDSTYQYSYMRRIKDALSEQIRLIKKKK